MKDNLVPNSSEWFAGFPRERCARGDENNRNPRKPERMTGEAVRRRSGTEQWEDSEQRVPNGVHTVHTRVPGHASSSGRNHGSSRGPADTGPYARPGSARACNFHTVRQSGLQMCE